MTIARPGITIAFLLSTTPAAAIPPSSVTDARDPARQAAFCAAFLYLDGRSGPGADRRRRTAALNAWRAELRRQRPDDAGQFFQSALDVNDNASPDDRASAVAYCESHAPRRGRHS